MVQVSRSKPNRKKWKSIVKQKGRFRREDREMVLVEFKAPRELVEAFDSALKPRFTSRSEAIRYLMRALVEASQRADWGRQVEPKNEH